MLIQGPIQTPDNPNYSGPSYSRLRVYMDCKQQYDYRYIKRIQLRRDRPNMDLGKAVHQGLAEFLREPIRGHGAIDQGIQSWHADFAKRAGDLSEEESLQVSLLKEQAVDLCIRTARELDIGHRWETLTLPGGGPIVEYRFQIELENHPHPMYGYIDWAGRELENGNVWLVDHKVRETFRDMEEEQYNLQMSIYQHAFVTSGIKVGGTLSHQIKSVVPRQPKINKDGSVSRTLITTDWPTYSAAVTAQGLDPADYGDMKEKLQQIEFWRYSRAFRSEKELINLWGDINSVVDEMSLQDQLGEMRAYRNLQPRLCKSCLYKELCFAELQGGDVDFLMKTAYRRADEPEAPFEAPELED